MKKQKNKNKYTKKYYEQYALFALAECYEGFCLNKFKKEESPDWISEELNIGIEVVRAISKEEGEETSILQTFFGKGNNGQDIKLEVIRRYENTERKCLIDDIKLYNNIAPLSVSFCFYSFAISFHYKIFCTGVWGSPHLRILCPQMQCLSRKADGLQVRIILR